MASRLRIRPSSVSSSAVRVTNTLSSNRENLDEVVVTDVPTEGGGVTAAGVEGGGTFIVILGGGTLSGVGGPDDDAADAIGTRC